MNCISMYVQGLKIQTLPTILSHSDYKLTNIIVVGSLDHRGAYYEKSMGRPGDGFTTTFAIGTHIACPFWDAMTNKQGTIFKSGTSLGK